VWLKRIRQINKTEYRGLQMNLNGKTIVVTGGGQGLGRAMALSLAKTGAKLALIDLNEEQ
jgi:short-subunit dehydrogenase